MKDLIYSLLISFILISCNSNNNENNVREVMPDKSVENSDSIPKVTGIGGIFFFSENPEETKKWYAENLGLVTNEWGSTFEFRNTNRPDEINYLQWSPFKSGSEYFAPSKREFMINYRVQNIEGLVKKLEANGVRILDTLETYDYGKFIHIMDAEGNKIELWEPIDSVLTKIDAETTK
ncbi:MAG: VOC family protein [Ignavibacteriales bacterium]|nr:VOC family protein [Ignavibacteriales bacterium]MCF8436259.1 VOC family protein [Ignavibacteriales bacterium]